MTMEGPEYEFIWKVTAISLYAIEEDDFIASEIFKGSISAKENEEDSLQGPLEGTHWRLLFYPKGDQCKGYLSLFLQRADDHRWPDRFWVSYRLSIVDSDGEDRFGGSFCKELFCNGTARGKRKLVSRQDILNGTANFTSDDCLTFKCCISKISPEDDVRSTLGVCRTVIPTESAKFCCEFQRFCEDVSVEAKAITYFANNSHVKFLKISCYPDSQAQLRVDFQLSEGVEDRVFFKAKIGIVGTDGRVQVAKDGQHHFVKHGESWSFPALMSMEKLLERRKDLLPDGALTLKFDIRYSDGKVTTTSVDDIKPCPAPKLKGGTTLLQDISSQEDSKSRLFPDIQLVAEG